MKKSAVSLSLIALILGSASFAAKKQNDPVVMTVGPENVTLSEFEYLFNKNREQQSEATDLDTYIDMFVNYKLKVAAAKDAGVDTTASYLAEMKKYSEELAAPYLRTKSVDDSLVQVAYDHSRQLIDVRHILLPGPKTMAEEYKARAFADSIRGALAAGADFAEAAKKYSLDRSTLEAGGHMGYIAGGMWPYTFEDLAFNTPAGQVSEVAESRFGYHILIPGDRKPNPGTVKARHILKSTRDLMPDKQALQKVTIDSLYQLLMNGADFVELAKNNTDEPQGKKTGGDLNWFGYGQMVKEFNDAVFAMKPGEISKPIKTTFGWHIILCEDRKDIPPIDSVRTQLEKRILNDERSMMAIDRTLENWIASRGATLTDAALNEAADAFRKQGGLNEAAIAMLKPSKTVAATIGNQVITVGDIAARLLPNPQASSAMAREIFSKRGYNLLKKAAMTDYIEALPASEPAYRNLINEYRDGMLLFEISNSKVWDRTGNDTEGLQKYYEAHRDDFKWDRPHYKGYVLAATNDSIAEAARTYLVEQLKVSEDALDAKNVRKKFGNDVKVERVLAAKGDNTVIDNLVFNGPRPAVKNRWTAYRTIAGNVIDQPEDALDVKGPVSLAYQQQLENDWLNELHKKYKVKVDRKKIHKSLDPSAKR